MTQPAQYARCPECGVPYFPVHTLTPCGHDTEPALHALDAPGAVYAWTRSHGADGPVLIAMTDFLGGELRVTAPIVDLDEIAVGDELVVRSTEDGGFVLAAPAA